MNENGDGFVIGARVVTWTFADTPLIVRIAVVVVVKFGDDICLTRTISFLLTVEGVVDE
jgi:hypothetical protein